MYCEGLAHLLPRRIRAQSYSLRALLSPGVYSVPLRTAARFHPASNFSPMSGAPALPRCTDPPSSRLPVLNCAGIPDEGGFSHNGTEVRQHLCPTLDRLLRASCSQLSSPTAVASLLASELGLLSASARPSRAIDPSQATLMTGHCD